MALRMYLGGTLVSNPWADPRSVQNAQKAWRTAGQFSIDFAVDVTYLGTPGLFPMSSATAGAQLWYIDYDTVTPANSTVLFGGIVKAVTGTDTTENVKGKTTVTCTTPLQELKRVMEDVVFTPDPTTGYPNDRTRVLRLGVLANMQGWDWTSGISATPSVTYPVPPLGEATTEYEQKSIEDILNDLATDPGQPGDTGYPVPTRRWWISARLTDPSTPAAGVTWVLNYTSPLDIPDATLELKDVKATPTDTAVIYETGATWGVDASQMIRTVNVAGPRTTPTLCTWQSLSNVTAGHGHITKYAGTDGTWDAGAVSKQRFKGGDWEATAIVQEFYLAHHTFQLDDGPIIGKANTGQQTINYYPDLIGNTLGTRGWHAVPRLHTGIAIAVWECHAATCILREHFSVPRQGQAMVFRLTDADNYYRVEDTGGDYSLIKRQGGAESTLGTLGVAPADGDQIKVFALGSQIQVYATRAGVPEGTYNLQVTGQTFNQSATMHGLYVNCDAAANSYEASFYDFQCTTFFSDDAFGIGTQTSVASWTDISYGIVKNNNGTITCTEGGLTYETSDYSYNDVFRVATMLTFDPATASFPRLVVWEKLPSGASEWIRLRTRSTGVVTLDNTHPWYVQFAAADLGATLNNISLRKQYSNLFHADPAVYGTYPGEWPANGLYQSDDLDTYVKRQTYADALFLQYATPRVSLNCELKPADGKCPFALGERVQVTHHGAGWLNGTPDTRKALIVTSIQRIENPHKLTRPTYRLTLADKDYTVDLTGRRHLLKPGTRTNKPTSRGVPTQSATDNTVFEWPDPTGDQNFGDYMEVQLARVDSGAYANAQIPAQRISPDASAVQLDKGSLVPGAQYVMRSRNVSNAGLASDWTESSAFVAPGQTPYSRPYSLQFYVDGSGPGVQPGYYEAIPVPETGTITAWELISTINTGLAGPGTVQLDVQYASPDDLRVSGASAFASIAGTQYPTLTTQETADSANLSTWSAAVKAGGKIRFVVLGPSTVPVGPTPNVQILTANLTITRGNPA